MSTHELGLQDLSVEDVVRLVRDPHSQLVAAPAALDRVTRSRAEVHRIVEEYKAAQNLTARPVLDYGVTTGFGEFKRVPIAPSDLAQLQKNIILSHAAGVGVTANPHDLTNYYPADVVRGALLLRINAFLHGHSGVSRELVDRLLEIFNKGVVPLVPVRGSVGSSGDLCPLAHLALVLFDEGRKHTWFYQVTDAAHLIRHPRLSFVQEGMQTDSACVVRSATELGTDPALQIPSHEFREKEGLALTNGATFSAAMLALAVHDAEQLTNSADIALALSLEAARGCARAFDARVHEARRQRGQQVSAGIVRDLVAGSQLVETADEVQDPYSIRCGPAVHGASRDTVAFVRTIVTREINAATDNPLFFGEAGGWDGKFAGNWAHRFDKNGGRVSAYDGNKRHSFSAGNFHGQPVGLAADYLAIAMAELANISERRTQFLMDADHNRGLPPNLVANAGLNSGFMIAQYCAAGLVSENKVFTHPASVDSIPTSSNSEDHNSMATIAAVKLRHVLAMTRFALAIELMVAVQGVEWAALLVHHVWPLGKKTVGLDELISKYLEARADKTKLAADAPWKDAQTVAHRLSTAEADLFTRWSTDFRSEVAGYLGVGTRGAYTRLREVVAPLTTDSVLSVGIAEVAALVGPYCGDTGTLDLVDAVNSSLKRSEVAVRLRRSHTFTEESTPDAES